MVASPDSAAVDTPVCSPDNKYVRREMIGRGSFKSIYKAYNEEDGLEVAWNEVAVPRNDRGRKERIKAEIGLLSNLSNPHIISVFDSWEDAAGGCFVFITELMTSGTLRKFILDQRGQVVRRKTIQNFCVQILDALIYLHSINVIHRDLKCDNIFLNGNRGEVKIGDFGLSIALVKTYAQSVIGTPEFMAPELYEEKYTEKVDIYSFGMCLLEMATGEYPYLECENVGQVFRKVTTGVKPLALEKITQPDLKDCVLACLNPAPQRPSAVELLNFPFFREALSPDSIASHSFYGHPSGCSAASLAEKRSMSCSATMAAAACALASAAVAEKAEVSVTRRPSLPPCPSPSMRMESTPPKSRTGTTPCCSPRMTALVLPVSLEGTPKSVVTPAPASEPTTATSSALNSAAGTTPCSRSLSESPSGKSPVDIALSRSPRSDLPSQSPTRTNSQPPPTSPRLAVLPLKKVSSESTLTASPMTGLLPAGSVPLPASPEDLLPLPLPRVASVPPTVVDVGVQAASPDFSNGLSELKTFPVVLPTESIPLCLGPSGTVRVHPEPLRPVTQPASSPSKAHPTVEGSLVFARREPTAVSPTEPHAKPRNLPHLNKLEQQVVRAISEAQHKAAAEEELEQQEREKNLARMDHARREKVLEKVLSLKREEQREQEEYERARDALLQRLEKIQAEKRRLLCQASPESTPDTAARKPNGKAHSPAPSGGGGVVTAEAAVPGGPSRGTAPLCAVPLQKPLTQQKPNGVKGTSPPPGPAHKPTNPPGSCTGTPVSPMKDSRSSSVCPSLGASSSFPPSEMIQMTPIPTPRAGTTPTTPTSSAHRTVVPSGLSYADVVAKTNLGTQGPPRSPPLLDPGDLLEAFVKEGRSNCCAKQQQQQLLQQCLGYPTSATVAKTATLTGKLNGPLAL
eukprot:RCo049760